MKIILSGGGTGGHIYPAVAVAEALQRRLPGDVELLFVGALGQMEMEKIPALGYSIHGLPVAGLWRRLDWRNFVLPFKVARSFVEARRLVRRFGADVVVGFGGYASAPVLAAAQSLGVPTVVQEQNSFAGLTNRLVGRRARSVCVAYSGMERFFPAGAIVHTGNPLRGRFAALPPRSEALDYFGLSADRPTLLVVGGSLGCRTFNDMMMRAVRENLLADIQVIWQTGHRYFPDIEHFMSTREVGNIWFAPFIHRMEMAYAAAELVIARSGAGTVSELSLVGLPTIFVPSPSVADDHQTKNALALVESGAAEMCSDSRAVTDAIDLAKNLLSDPRRLASLSENIKSFGTPDSAEKIVDLILRHAKK